MNLHQFRVLNAVLRLPKHFTTSDLVRESGESNEVVRKTYQRYENLFTIVATGKPKVRSLTSAGREKLLQDLRESQSRLPPPPMARGPEGEPLGLAGAERVLYELIPASDADSRAPLLREARSHLELADQERELADEPTQNVSVEVRLDAVRRMLGYVEVLHRAKEQLESRTPDAGLSSIDTLATALINGAAAQEFFCQPKSGALCTGLLDLLDLRARAPEEADRVAQALLALEREPAWCKALGISGAFWTAEEKTSLETCFRDGAAMVMVVPRIDEPFTIVESRDEVKHDNPRVTGGLISKDIKSMDDLFVHQLQDIYYAEKLIVGTLPDMIAKATSPELKSAFEAHLGQTKNHVKRLEQVFLMHGAQPKQVNCSAIDGILEEAQEVGGEIEDKSVLDAALIASAQAVEHYEMTRYGTLIAWAKTLGRVDCAQVLQQNLAEAQAADEKLTTITESNVNQAAA